MVNEEIELNIEEKKSHKITRSKKYILGLFIFLCFMEILDTYTTVIPTLIVSSVQLELFIEGMGMNQSQADIAYTNVLLIASIGMYFGIFSRLFADLTGRKIWLVITALGMGLGSIIIGISRNIIVYTIGLFILYVFYSSDIWAIYVAEEAPARKRGKYQNLVLVAGLLAAVFAFVLMGIFITDEAQNWRPLAYIGGFGILVAIFALIIDETAPYKEMEAARKAAGKPKNNPFKNLIQPFKGEYGKNLLPILIVMFVIGFTQSISTMTETLLARYLGHDATSLALMLMIVWILIAYLVIGWAMDKFGRKPIKLISSIIGPIAAVIYILGLTSWGWTNVLLLGSLNGIMGLAGQGILLPNKLAGYESVSTEIRGATASWMALIRAVGNTVGLFIGGLLINMWDLGIATLIITATYFVVIPVTLLWGKETKGIDMREV